VDPSHQSVIQGSEASQSGYNQWYPRRWIADMMDRLCSRKGPHAINAKQPPHTPPLLKEVVQPTEATPANKRDNYYKNIKEIIHGSRFSDMMAARGDREKSLRTFHHRSLTQIVIDSF
jgi:hypothetical protein